MAASMSFDFSNARIRTGMGNIGSYNHVYNLPDIRDPPPALRRSPAPSAVFTGRTSELDKIEACLFKDPEVHKRKIFVVSGLGGAGKSQIAYKFIHDRVGSRIPETNIFYIDASTDSTIESSFRTIALATNNFASTANVLDWLAGFDDWLLFFNNADDPKIDLHQFFPPSQFGKILITTRNRNAAHFYSTGLCCSIEVTNLPRPDALALLLQAAQLQGKSFTEAEADELLSELQCFPLAIAQAGAAINGLNQSVSEYCRLFQRRRTELMRDDAVGPEALDGYQWTVYTTWRINYDSLSPPARGILDVCAFLHHDGISEQIFQSAAEGTSTFRFTADPTGEGKTSLDGLVDLFSAFRSTSDPVWDTIQFRKTIKEITTYSLIDYDEMNSTYFIHPLVHDWTRTISRSGIKRLSAQTLLAIASRAAAAERNINFGRKLLSHIDTVMVGQEEKDVPVDVISAYRSIQKLTSSPQEDPPLASGSPKVEGPQEAMTVDSDVCSTEAFSDSPLVGDAEDDLPPTLLCRAWTRYVKRMLPRLRSAFLLRPHRA